MKKTLSTLIGLSMMAAPLASAAASTRPAMAIPTMATSSYSVQMDEDTDDDRLFILAVMLGAVALFAITAFSDGDDGDEFAGLPPVSPG